MKKLVLLVVLALVLSANFTALTWGGVDLDKWVVFGTNDEPRK